MLGIDQTLLSQIYPNVFKARVNTVEPILIGGEKGRGGRRQNLIHAKAMGDHNLLVISNSIMRCQDCPLGLLHDCRLHLIHFDKIKRQNHLKI